MNEILLADTPLNDPKDDRLGFAPFAENLAKAISKVETDECLVFALYGPWGSGKTSCMNFVRYYINKLPEEEKPIVVEFNPWWFSGRGELLRQFLREFLVTLGKKEELKKVSDSIGDLLVAASFIPYAKNAGQLIKQFTKEKSFVKIKEEIRKILIKGENRFLIIIDDIDRLTSDEIRSLFCVIKAIADFPKTAYLLAFDKKIIVDALSLLQESSSHEKRGEDFLEKIVQVPFDLPTPEKTRLNRLFTERLDAVFSDSKQIDQTYWGNVFLSGIDYYIDTVRNVKRLTNALKVSYPAVKGDVNPIDFIAIETIRIFRSNVYHIIRGNPDKFTGHADLPFYGEDRIEKIKPFHEKWLDDIPEEEKEILKDILIRIFPKLEAVFKNTIYGADYLSEWRRENRICSPDIFPVYFRLALPEGKISTNEMKSILALAGDAEQFGQELIQLSKQIKQDGSTRVSEVLERLEDYTDKDIPKEQIPTVLQALFHIGDKLLLEADEGRGLFGLGNNIRIGRLMFQLIRRYDSQEERFQVLKDAFSKGEAAAMIVGEVTSLGQQQGKYESQKKPENQWFINSEQLVELEEIALQKIKDSAAKKELMEKSRAIQMLYRWKEWENEDVVKQYVAEYISSDEKLTDFLSLYLSKSSSWGMDDKVPRYQWRLDPKYIEPFVDDLEKIDERCKKILEEKPDWLNEKRKTAVETFTISYDRRLKGKDIDDDLEEDSH